jgi:hypothetical protein
MHLKIHLEGDNIVKSYEGTIGDLSALLLSLADTKEGTAVVLLAAATLLSSEGRDEAASECARLLEEVLQSEEVINDEDSIEYEDV